MRDLFRFLFKIRNTLLFLVLMALSYAWTIAGNEHHRAQAVGTANTAVGRVYAWRTDITEYTSLRDVNLRLANENADLRRRDRSSYAPVYSRFIAFQDTIHEVRYDILAARVVNSTTHRQRNTITLDKGTQAGVGPDMGVIGTDGIVGVVSAAGPRFSVVVSVLDPELNTSVVLPRSGHFGLLSWDTSDPRTASVVDIGKHAPVKQGDTLVTRGGDGIFPPGIPVGVVTELRNDPSSNYHTITVRLTEDLTRSGPVYVVKDLAKMERDSLEAQVVRP
ncbi:MAG: rod shape-determining protein MreC [Flavobacteriales bacterium]|nr:rod shape-determining protein MreC [Flavobacteriales bacterium]MBP6698807.1 rod shape-determining protein MreC [Flavobacteriales bacterium]